MVNYYEILEVSQKASKEVIEKAYKALAKKYHPDLNQDNKKEAEMKMQKINEAYDVLIDENKRANFDRVLERKQQIELNKQKHETTSEASFKDSNDNFVINTTNMDEKTKKKIQNKLQEKYLEAYDSYLREHGYKLKYKWTFKRVIKLILAIIIIILFFTILFFIPPIHKWCISIYEENFAIKLIVDIIVSIFKSIGSIFTS